MAPLSLSKHRTSLFLIIMVGTLGNFINIVGVDGATTLTPTFPTPIPSIPVPSTPTSSASSWCVARSDASTQALQTALDYACGTGADCAPIQSTGLCYLPNTIQAHTSYAYNSYYQRKAMAPGSCDFAGTATIAQTDPSYGSCVYPSSSSAAGGTTAPPSGIPGAPATPTTTTPTFSGGGVGVLNPGMTPTIPDDNSKASPGSRIPTIWMTVSFILVLLVTLKPIGPKIKPIRSFVVLFI